MVLYHEEIHNFLNPILSKDWSHYSNNLFKDSLNDNVGSSNTFNETVTRALTNMVLETYHPSVDTQVILHREIQDGWVNMDQVYNFIKENYLSNRTLYPTIDSFMPTLRSYVLTLDKTHALELLNQTLYDVTLTPDSKSILGGGEAFCDELSMKIYSKIFKQCSLNFIRDDYFNDPHMVMFIDAHSSYNNLPSKIKNQISSSDYNAIAPDTSVAFKVENAQLVLVK